MTLRAVQYAPEFCTEAKADLCENGRQPFDRFDSSHDLSVIDSEGKRHRIGQFTHADWALAIGKLIEQHGLPGLPAHNDDGTDENGQTYEDRLAETIRRNHYRGDE